MKKEILKCCSLIFPSKNNKQKLLKLRAEPENRLMHWKVLLYFDTKLGFAPFRAAKAPVYLVSL